MVLAHLIRLLIHKLVGPDEIHSQLLKISAPLGYCPPSLTNLKQLELLCPTGNSEKRRCDTQTDPCITETITDQ